MLFRSAAPKAAPVATPAAPAKPATPRTWASLAASAHKVAMPTIPSSSNTQQAPSQPKSTTSPSAPASASAPSQPTAVPAQVSTPVREASPANSQGDAAGWQTAGHKKEQSRAQNASTDADQKRAYIKNVYSQVEDGALRSALSQFGEIEYLDISRGKVGGILCNTCNVTDLLTRLELCFRRFQDTGRIPGRRCQQPPHGERHRNQG